jgi:hypothetical protein
MCLPEPDCGVLTQTSPLGVQGFGINWAKADGVSRTNRQETVKSCCPRAREQHGKGMSLRFLLQPLTIVPAHLCPQVLRSRLGFAPQEIREGLSFLSFVNKRRAHLPQSIEWCNRWVGNHGRKNVIAFQDDWCAGFAVVHDHGGKRWDQYLADCNCLRDDMFERKRMRGRMRAPEVQHRLLLRSRHALEHNLKIIDFVKSNVKMMGKAIAQGCFPGTQGTTKKKDLPRPSRMDILHVRTFTLCHADRAAAASSIIRLMTAIRLCIRAESKLAPEKPWAKGDGSEIG